jgi:ABC-type Fe3+-hydroxamate transport system substrate-binding protein
MKKMLLVFIFSLTIMLSSCTKNSTQKVLDDLSDHSNFLYDLNSTVTDDMKSQFVEFPGFGMYTLVDSTIDINQDDIWLFMQENPTTYYDVSGYPDCLYHEVITRIYTSDPSIYVYDFSVGDIYDDDVVSLLESKGFDKIEDSQYSFKHEDVIIRFMCTKEDIIYQISVSLVSTCDVIF